MTIKRLAIPFTFAAGLALGAATGIYGKGLYDEVTAPKPLSIGDHFRAAVTDVYDADTMTVLRGDTEYKIRIWGIDAPERSQRCLEDGNIKTCGLMARDELRELVLDKEVDCELKGFDNNHDRLIAQCFVDGIDPISAIVEQGWAFSDTQYSNDPYGAQQSAAQNAKRGIWATEIMQPREWRACQAYNRGGTNIPAQCYKPLGPVNP